ncbi:hypothetical protein ACHAXA_006104 [Cyclostephanos tholiformis]|uniref:protein-serine/threonine phosphatase n=1 Tax=Cyclostephanos tholiformis TaxID=382380 RepID=A0ABD3R0L0_9STRA
MTMTSSLPMNRTDEPRTSPLTSPPPTTSPSPASSRLVRPRLSVDVNVANNNHDDDRGRAIPSQYRHGGGNKTPAGIRGHSDLRSPGMKATPTAANGSSSSSNPFANSMGPVAMEFEVEDDATTDDVTTTDEDDDDDAAEAGITIPPNADDELNDDGRQWEAPDLPSPLANFITQTDRHGNASTPRSETGGAMVDPSARARHHRHQRPSSSATNPAVVVGDDDDDDVAMVDGDDVDVDVDVNNRKGGRGGGHDPASSTLMASAVADDACEQLIDGIRRMCCCLLPGDGVVASSSGGAGGGIIRLVGGARVGSLAETSVDAKDVGGAAVLHRPSLSSSSSYPSPSHDAHTLGYPADHPIGYSTRGHDAPPLMEEDSALTDNPRRIRLLPELHRDDIGKKCLVLDLDETLVHSSFRAVPGADFVIPVQIEDVVHFVYVAKRPGVDEFLLEMARYYEIVVYTASLNKYADVLLDLLDPHRVIRTRLFRESCVYYEGNYVKDLCLLNRDLSQTIIIDNSPASYMFHPENAIDCSSFIDDVSDRELEAIGKFLVGVKDVGDVRGTVNLWRHWPNVDLTKNHRRVR